MTQAPNTKAPLAGVRDDDRGLFEGLKESAGEVLDLFTGVDQSDVAAGRVDIDTLSREDKIELLVDGQTSSIIGSSPWSVGVQLNASVVKDIHEDAGQTLVFAIDAGFLDAAESAFKRVRYALVWDDAVVAETGQLSVSVVKTFLILGIGDEPRGKTLTLWITDDDLRVIPTKQGPLKDLESIRKEVVGEIGAAADKAPNPFAKAADDALGFLTATQIGGVVILLAAIVGLVIIIRSEAGKDVAHVIAKAVK